MNKKRLILPPLSILLVISLFGQTKLTWSEHIAPIVYKNCTSCHHKGGAAPFSLMTYKEAFKLKLAIRHSVLSGHMPPWPPDTTYSKLAFPRALNAKDYQAILDWVNEGAEEGDPTKAPTPPVYTDAPAIADAQFAKRVPQYTVTDNRDVYRCYPMKSGTTTDKFITAMECLPSNGRIVHHVLIFQDQANTCFDLDARDPEPGYASFGGVGSNSAELIGGWVPGSRPYLLPKGMGIRLKANANIIVQIHYAPGSTGQSDSTQLRFRFGEGNLRAVFVAPILNHAQSLTNGPLFIPANTVKTFYSQFTMPADATVISVAPHMHYIGQKIKAFAVPPTGDTIRLIKINNWDFHWQGAYMFKKAIKLPRLSRLMGEATYDNTVFNFNNPNSPPKDISLGESTTDEMMLLYFSFLAYQPGDENLDLEQSIIQTDNDDIPPLSKMPFSAAPNPASSDITLSFELDKPERLLIQIFDYQGILIKNITDQTLFNQGKNQKTIAVNDLPIGAYLVKISSDKIYGIQAFVKQ